MPPSSIAHFETGTRKPSFDTLRRIANALTVALVMTNSPRALDRKRCPGRPPTHSIGGLVIGILIDEGVVRYTVSRRLELAT